MPDPVHPEMKPRWFLHAPVVVFLALNIASTGNAQILMQARFEGNLLPVVDCDIQNLYVLKDGRRMQTDYADYRMKPATAFGPGFIDILNVQTDLDPLRNSTAVERTKPDAVGFRFDADVASDRDLKHCYALLTFVANGSVGAWFVHVGNLKAGAKSHVKVAFRDHVDAVGPLHLFSESMEIPSTQLPKAYDFREQYAALVRGAPGLPALELTKLDRIFPHVLSPDGRLLATTRDRGDHIAIIVYDLQATKLLCDLPAGDFDDDAYDLTWISDHEVAYIRIIRGVDANGWPEDRRELTLLDVTTGKTQEIRMRVTVFGIIQALSKQSGVAVLLMGRDYLGAWTEKYDFHARRLLNWTNLDSGYFLVDDAGEPRVHYEYDGSKLEYDARPNRDSSWKGLDGRVKEPGLKFNLRGEDLIDRVADILSIGPDGDLLYIASRLHSDRFELAAYSMSEGVIKQTIASHPRYDLTNADGGSTRLLFRKNTSQLIGMVFDAQKPTVVWLDPAFKAVQQAMDKTFPDHVNLPMDWSEDGRTFIYFSFSDKDPGTYYVFRPLESRLMPLLVVGERLKGKELASTVPLEFAARDGTPIHGYVTYPPGPRSKQAPLVVSVHGGPTVRDRWGFDPTNQFLATRGYIVLQVNYRGSSGYGAAYQRAGLRARLDTVIIDDIADGTRYLISKGEVDPKRIAIMGGSFGGWATYLGLIRYPDLYRVGIAQSAVSHWRTTLTNDRRGYIKFGYAFWKALLARQGFATEEASIDPYLREKEITQPILILHGQSDENVRVEEAQLMIKALRRHNSQVDAIIFPHAGHTWNEWTDDDRVRRLNEISAFLSRHLGGDAADSGAKPAAATPANPPPRPAAVGGAATPARAP